MNFKDFITFSFGIKINKFEKEKVKIEAHVVKPVDWFLINALNKFMKIIYKNI